MDHVVARSCVMFSAVLPLAACSAVLDFDAVAQEQETRDASVADACTPEAKFSRSDDVVFLVDCDGADGVRHSEMDWYAKFACAQSGELPEATAITTTDPDQTTTWEGNTTTGYYPDNEFVATIDMQVASVYGIQGTGHNRQKPFLCYRDTWRVLYITDEMTCRSRYYCRPTNPAMK